MCLMRTKPAEGEGKAPLRNKEAEPQSPERWGNSQHCANKESPDLLYKGCQNPNSIVQFYF